MTLADDFLDEKLRPSGKSVLRWLQTLGSIASDSRKDTPGKRFAVERCSMWLSVNMQEVVSQGAGLTDDIIPHMIHFLR